MKAFKEFGEHWFFGAEGAAIVICVAFLLAYQGRHVGLFEGLELLLYILAPFICLCLVDLVVHKIKFPKTGLARNDKIALIITAFLFCLTLFSIVFRVWR